MRGGSSICRPSSDGEQLRWSGVTCAPVALEPLGRNVAAVVTEAALAARSCGMGPMRPLMQADHVVSDRDAFQSAVAAALPFMPAGAVVTFGFVSFDLGGAGGTMPLFINAALHIDGKLIDAKGNRIGICARDR